MRLIRGVFCASIFALLSFAGQAQQFTRIDTQSVVECPAEKAGEAPPSFKGPSCRTIPAVEIDPQNRHIWIKASIALTPETLEGDDPLGVFVVGKASSRFFLNGVFIGANGTPGATPEEEVPGKMDAVFFADKNLLKVGNNDLILELSGHHSLMTLGYPLHLIAIGPYSDPQQMVLRTYVRSLLPFGILLVGAFYFGIQAFRRDRDLNTVLVPLIAFFAAAQLAAEVSRGLIAYSYPFHDMRLIAVLVCAFACGSCLTLHIADSFIKSHKALIAALSVIVTIVVIWLSPGYDGKTIMAVLMPALVSLAIVIKNGRARGKIALAYAIVLSLFILLTVPNGFLDVYFYYSVAGLLLFLFHQEIRKISEENKLRLEEKARADRLQLVLDESREKTSPSQLKVTQQGKVDLIPTDKISVCKGARDYVELEIEGTGSILHSSSLTELEKELPATFLRVHRSYIVNTFFIRSLERDASGSGVLKLNTGATIPVSRRILPKVRKALS